MLIETIELNQENDRNDKVEEADIMRSDIDGAETNDVECDENKRQILEQLKDIMAEGRTNEGIIIKKVDKKILEFITKEVNGTITFMKRKDKRRERA